MTFKTLDDMGDISGKRVLVREDLNVPMKDGVVTDDTRLRATAETLTELADRGAKVFVLAHFGRPKGQVVADMSLKPVVEPLAKALGRPVAFLEDCRAMRWPRRRRPRQTARHRAGKYALPRGRGKE
jgi:phosphoglycerate kinase